MCDVKKEREREREREREKKEKGKKGKKKKKKYFAIPNFYTAYYQVEFVPGFTLCDMQLPA